MTQEEVKKIAEQQVSILSCSGDEKIHAQNGFILGYQYFSVFVSDMLRSPELLEMLSKTSGELSKHNVEGLAKELSANTEMSLESATEYAQFLEKFFKSSFDSGVISILQALKTLLTVE